MEPAVLIAAIAAVVAIIGTVGGLVGALSKTNADRRTAMETRLDKRIDDAMDAQDKRIASLELAAKRHMSAVGRIFRAIRDQWPDAHGPNLDPADIAELEDTEALPREWIRRRP